MAIAQVGLLDLSDVTDFLISKLQTCLDSSILLAANPFTIELSGSMPGAVRDLGECQLSLYLFHVAADPYLRNVPPVGPGNPPVGFQPLGLDLYYLLTAYSEADYVEEQRAMSVAVRCLHQLATATFDADLDGTLVKNHVTITLQSETADELSRLWQAASVPFRLAAVYKVSVVLLAPDLPTLALAPKPTTWTVVAHPAALPLQERGQLLGTHARISYLSPTSDELFFDLSPAIAAAGQRFSLYGGGLDTATAASLFLVDGAGVQQEVTAWKAAGVAQTATRLTLELPTVGGAAPGGTPDPGVYQVFAGQEIAGALVHQSNATPFSIAARIDTADPPLLPVGGELTITGVGFVAGGTQVLFETVPLEEVAAAPGPGQFRVVSATELRFRAPAALSPGRYGLRVRVNRVESSPSWWVDVP